MKIHLLRPESITPIAIYLMRRDEMPDSAARQLEFAVVLLYREFEYRQMYGSGWLMRRARPAPAAGSPFAPYDITMEAASDLAALIDDPRLIWAATPRPDDLFGLKPLAIQGLRRTLRNRQADAFGWLVLARLQRQMTDYAGAEAAAARAAALGESDADFNDRIRKLAWRLRSQAEGEAFTRFLTTEKAFCEREREAAMAGFDETQAPEALRPLVPLARQLGVGDDACRGWFVSKMKAAERRASKALIAQHAAAIDDWLSTLRQPYEGAATAFFWLRHCGEEL